MKRNEKYSLRTIGDSYYLIPQGDQIEQSNGLIELNTTGYYIWKLLAKDRNLDELTLSVANHFDIEFDKARQDIQIFLDQISKLGLLEKNRS